MKTCNVVSYDVGQSGGKIRLGRFDGERLTTETAFRHHNSVVSLFGDHYWDFFQLYEMRNRGLAEAAAMVEGDIAAVSSTTFGNNFIMLDERDRVYTVSYGVYPERLDAALDEVAKKVPLKELHLRTGCERRNYITAAQLMAYRIQGEAGAIDRAAKILLFPDALNYTLSHVAQTEATIASTGGLFDPAKGDWARDVMARLGFDAAKFPGIVMPNTIQGPIMPELCERLRLKKGAMVVNAAGHDTSSAAYALPSKENAAFISIGTMALICLESDRIVSTEETYEAGFGCCSTPDGRRMMMAAERCMWHIEKCLEYYRARGEDIDYADLISLAAREKEMQRFIDIDDDDYLSCPAEVPERIADYCRKTGQAPITERGELFRTIFDSIAWAITREMRTLQRITGITPDSVYVLGGGGKNGLLMQLLADCMGMRIVIPQYEATSYGVMVSELTALGELKDRSEAKEMIARSVDTIVYEPQRSVDLSGAAAHWANGKKRLREL